PLRASSSSSVVLPAPDMPVTRMRAMEAGYGHYGGSVRPFEELVDEAAAADVGGWGFEWLDGRASEERPPWGYAGLLAGRLARVGSALDIGTGGGEVVAEAPDVARAHGCERGLAAQRGTGAAPARPTRSGGGGDHSGFAPVR